MFSKWLIPYNLCFKYKSAKFLNEYTDLPPTCKTVWYPSTRKLGAVGHVCHLVTVIVN